MIDRFNSIFEKGDFIPEYYQVMQNNLTLASRTIQPASYCSRPGGRTGKLESTSPIPSRFADGKNIVSGTKIGKNNSDVHHQGVALN